MISLFGLRPAYPKRHNTTVLIHSLTLLTYLCAESLLVSGMAGYSPARRFTHGAYSAVGLSVLCKCRKEKHRQSQDSSKLSFGRAGLRAPPPAQPNRYFAAQVFPPAETSTPPDDGHFGSVVEKSKEIVKSKGRNNTTDITPVRMFTSYPMLCTLWREWVFP